MATSTCWTWRARVIDIKTAKEAQQHRSHAQVPGCDLSASDARREGRGMYSHAGENQIAPVGSTVLLRHRTRAAGHAHSLSRGPGTDARRGPPPQSSVHAVQPEKLRLLAALRTALGRRGSGDLKPARNPAYLAWIRTQPCVVCGSTRWIEAAHTGPYGLARSRQIPPPSRYVVCTTAPEKTAITKLVPRKFAAVHDLDIFVIIERLNLKPIVRIAGGLFVAHLEGQRYDLGKIENGIESALRNLQKQCGENRLAQEIANDSPCWRAGSRKGTGVA